MPEFHSSLHKFPIFTKTYDLYKAFYEYLPSFPKKERYTFGHKCEILLLETLEGIILASTLPRRDKLPVLKKASRKLDVLKVLFALGRDLKIIENQKYAVLDSSASEIGRMFGGWIKITSEHTT